MTCDYFSLCISVWNCETQQQQRAVQQFSSILVNFCELLLYSFCVSSLSSSFAPWRFPHFSFTLCSLWTRNEWMKNWKLNMRKNSLLCLFCSCSSALRFLFANCWRLLCDYLFGGKITNDIKGRDEEEEVKRRRRLGGNREEQNRAKQTMTRRWHWAAERKSLIFFIFSFSRAFLFHECCHINFQQSTKQAKKEGRSNEAAKVH